jgi:hypothetical protein
MKPRARLPVLITALAAALALAGAGPGAVSSALADDDGYRDNGYRDNGYRDNGYRDHDGYDHDDDEYDDDDDHDRARRLMERGDIRPLHDILGRVRDDLPGRIIATDFEREDGIYVYEFKVVDSGGRVREVYVDAATARILKIEDDD